MRRSDKKPGFALPAVLIVVGAMLILAIGILLVTGIERDTARSFVDRQRAEIAARAGLEELRGILAMEADNDDYIILQSTVASEATPGNPIAPHLFIARGEPDSDPFKFRYIPLFSALKRPEPSELKAPEIDPLIGSNDQRTSFGTLPYQPAVGTAWLPVLDENGNIVARYAWWVEDLQSRVDPIIAGNKKGEDDTHARVRWPFPAPGLNDLPDAANEPALNQIATFALDPEATDADQKSLGKTLFKNRKLLVSPDSLLAAANMEPPLQRDPNGELTDDIASAVQRGLVSGIRPYQEQPLVPFSAGIDPSVAGEPKLNLNKLLSTGGDAAVDEMADFINKALPEFGIKNDPESRPGGFPDDYVKTLAANAIDYADTDNNPTVKDDEYRGIDAYPLVSEFLFKPRIESVRVTGSRRYVDLSVTVYVELWNMTNVSVDGKAEITYETKYGVKIEPNSSGNPNAAFRLDDMSKASPVLGESNGYRWFPEFRVNLQPDEYHVYPCGMITYSFDVEDNVPQDDPKALDTIVKLIDEQSGPTGAGYRMRWNGKMMDQSRGGLRRNSVTLHYYNSDPTKFNSKDFPLQKVRCNIPGLNYRIGGDAFHNMGDPRIAYYNLASQDGNAYPQNYSPNRRNIRLDIYTPDNKRVVGRVLPSEWPDGGHDSPFGTDTLHGLLGMDVTAFDGDERIDPLDARFSNQPPDLTPGKEEAPTRISNSGRFYSVTELGRVYDPVMWQTLGGPNPSINPGSSWGNVNPNTASSSNHGGGNTLRIGRPEHLKFDEPGLRASHLLDLFHTGISRSADAALREGPLVKINGHVNLNTATKPALRQLIAGSLGQDPEIRRFVNDTHAGGSVKFPEIQKLSGSSVPDVTAIADRIANAIIYYRDKVRPFASTGELANTRESNDTRVFGNPELFPGFTNSGYPMLQWTDSAAEETFARAHDASTVRSRNFRIWVVGQSLAPSVSATASPKVLAEIRKAYTVFADPGERKPDGTPDPAKFRLKILHESDF